MIAYLFQYYASPHFCGETYCFCPVCLSVTQIVSATPLKLLNRISWSLVGSKDTICSCAYYQEILIACILWELCPFELDLIKIRSKHLLPIFFPFFFGRSCNNNTPLRVASGVSMNALKLTNQRFFLQTYEDNLPIEGAVLFELDKHMHFERTR
jgi:hypothetical protein